jgi:hypothetical protein
MTNNFGRRLRRWTQALNSLLDELIPDFYAKMALSFRSMLEPGQICETPVLYSYENAEVWRPSHYDSSQTQAIDFRPIPKPGDAYKKATVIQSPRLDAYEEFPVVRAKRRPVLLLAVDPPLIGAHPDKMKLDKHLCLVAPCYSVVDPMGDAKLQTEILDRIRRLEFPQLLFLPQAAAMSNDSLLRLDSIHNCYRSHLEPTEWKLSSDIWRIVLGQLDFIFSGIYAGEFKAARDVLQGK